MSAPTAILATEILAAVSDRSSWESKQAVYYQMRHEGLRRLRRPHKFAADLHFPLIDTAIEKLKPFYYAQAFGSQRLAQFVARKQELRPHSEACSNYFDWTLREESNLGTSLLSTIDYMAVRGVGISKVVWDHEEKRIGFRAIDPLYLVIPYNTTDLYKAEWICEVRSMSLAEYKRNRNFKQADSGVDYQQLLTNDDRRTGQANEQEKVRREGITYSAKKDTVIIWEVYRRRPRPGGGIGYDVHTFCPNRPDMPVRDPYQHPIMFQGQVCHPYVDFMMEVKDVGFYASRGVAERLAAHEAWACKLWNTKGDLIDYTAKPMFTGTGALPNATNIQFLPGEVLANGLQPVIFGKPPVDLDQEMASTRMVAEQSIMMPDFGVGGESGQQNKTATEVDYIRTLSSTGVDLRGKIFRLGFTRLLRVAWATQLHYRKEDVQYFVAGEIKTMEGTALVDEYHIVPDGSTDSWNKQSRVQRSLQRMNTLKGHPNANQEELLRDFLLEDDAAKAMKFFVPSNEKAASESKDEALEIILMEKGWPVPARLEQDHITRIQVLHGKLEQLAHLGEPVNPMFQRLMHQHLAMHVQMLQKVNPDAAKQIVRELIAAEQKPVAQPGMPEVMPPAEPEEAVL